jgi:hypothetical protein
MAAVRYFTAAVFVAGAEAGCYNESKRQTGSYSSIHRRSTKARYE